MPRPLSPALQVVCVPWLLELVLLSYLFVLPAHYLPKVPVCALRVYLYIVPPLWLRVLCVLVWAMLRCPRGCWTPPCRALPASVQPLEVSEAARGVCLP